MKTYSKLLLAFLLLILVVPQVVADEPASEWEKANKQAQSLGEDGKYNGAIVFAKKALELAEKNWPSVEEASSMLLSRKQVTAHNCDSAAEAMAQAESRNSGWTAYNARNVGGRTWVVSMKQN